MAKIYKRSDRIQIKVDDISIRICPLSYEQKAEIQVLMMGFQRGDFKAATQGTVLAMKCAIKEISGVEDMDGNPYKLAFDDSGLLTDDCVSELLDLELAPKLTMICMNLIRGIPSEFTNEQGQKLEGVEIIKQQDAVKNVSA